jgi:hypothetical protein
MMWACIHQRNRQAGTQCEAHSVLALELVAQRCDAALCIVTRRRRRNLAVLWSGRLNVDSGQRGAAPRVRKVLRTKKPVSGAREAGQALVTRQDKEAALAGHRSTLLKNAKHACAIFLKFVFMEKMKWSASARCGGHATPASA